MGICVYSHSIFRDTHWISIYDPLFVYGTIVVGFNFCIPYTFDIIIKHFRFVL
jgi:hypothetical protein